MCPFGKECLQLWYIDLIVWPYCVALFYFFLLSTPWNAESPWPWGTGAHQRALSCTGDMRVLPRGRMLNVKSHHIRVFYCSPVKNDENQSPVKNWSPQGHFFGMYTIIINFYPKRYRCNLIPGVHPIYILLEIDSWQWSRS